MGLDTTHGCWDGSYSAFSRFRQALATAAGLGDLGEYDGHGGPCEFDASDPLTTLLSHSDCDGEIATADCIPLAERLEALAQVIQNDPDDRDWRDLTLQFATGLRSAAAAGEPVEFF